MQVLRASLLVGAMLASIGTSAQTAPDTAREPVGIALEGFAYPYPVSFMPVTLGGESLRMAYMDVPPTGPPNGRTILLLHGRNFPASYWAGVIARLGAAGFRVVAPDQIGFGKSSKPVFDYHFDTMAASTAALLDRLGIATVDVVAHSMGGMLAVRLARAAPERVGRLVLEAPIGLEDYRFVVPPVSDERLVEGERNLTADGYRQQLVSNYAVARPELVEPFVRLRERIRGSGEYERWLRSFARSYQTIYREPVVHEIPLVAAPTLFVMGAKDRNAPGRPYAPPDRRAGMGDNARLAETLASRMPDGRAVVFPDVGHLVHMEAEERFVGEVLRFLQ